MGFVSTVGGQGRGREIDYSEMGYIICKLRTNKTFMFTRKENDLAWMDTGQRTITMVGGTYKTPSLFCELSAVIQQPGTYEHRLPPGM